MFPLSASLLGEGLGYGTFENLPHSDLSSGILSTSQLVVLTSQQRLCRKGGVFVHRIPENMKVES